MFAKNVAQKAAAEQVNVLKPGESAPRAARKLALFVAHGMGQQVPFETMDAVGQGLRRIAEQKGSAGGEPRAVTALVGSNENDGKDRKKLQRIELDLEGANGEGLEVHIYEGYWAPVTEGQVTTKDVLSFLIRGGFNGWRNAGRDFSRWMFGRAVDFGRQRGTAFSLATALLVVGALVAVNFVVTVLFAERLALKNAPALEGTFAALTTLIAGWVLATGAIGGLLLAVHLLKRSDWATAPVKREPELGLGARLLGWLLTLWVVATIALGVISVGAPLGWPKIDALAYRHFATVNWLTLLTWAGLIGVSLFIRGRLVQYPGDVAAYISSHTLDRFQEIRSTIKARVGEVAKAVYSDPAYEGVVWVGHSLGSVIVYDALNTVLVDDELAGGKLKAVERTRLLVTFGSPLDKIVFIFASQWAHSTGMRGALAASFQPLIQDYERFRGFPWVNIYSPADIISGPLDFFDPPQPKDSKQNPPYAARRVMNEIDPDASTPLLAHVEYWNNRMLYEAIYEGLRLRPSDSADATLRRAPSEDAEAA